MAPPPPWPRPLQLVTVMQHFPSDEDKLKALQLMEPVSPAGRPAAPQWLHAVMASESNWYVRETHIRM